MRTTGDRLAEREAFLRALEDEPYRHDFFQTLRRIECLFVDRPRIGTAARPADEPLRLGQSVSMVFAPAALAAFERGGGRAPRLAQHFFGLLGPNGPLPLHLTDHARERLMHGDATLARFLDLFHHRMLALFYRAWAQAQPTASLDRPDDDRFADFVGSLLGIGAASLRQRDAAGDRTKLFHAGLLSRQVRNADGLQALLAGFFRIPVRIEQFVGHWMLLPASDRTRLGRHGPGARLGLGTVVGARVWDRQHKFRIHLGPLPLVQYEDFLPGGSALDKLLALVRQYLCLELAWDARLSLVRAQVPPTRPGRFGRLGWTTWLGRPRPGRDPDDLLLDAEAVLARRRRRRGQRGTGTASTASTA